MDARAGAARLGDEHRQSRRRSHADRQAAEPKAQVAFDANQDPRPPGETYCIDQPAIAEAAVAAYNEALKEWTRERVPLDWAMSTGNQGVVLMLIAERIGDVTKARSAVPQIEVAFVTMRDGGNAPAAAYYEGQLPKARSLLNRLSRRSQ
jgi:hypothetical protein